MKISIITVCYNSASTIADTIRSVQKQKYDNYEHLIIDGGSTDETIAVVQSLANSNTRYISEVDAGIYDAMNKGLSLATGEVIGFINSDDFYASSSVLSLIGEVFKNPTVECCYGDLCYVDQFSLGRIVRYWHSNSFSPNLFRIGWCPPHPTFFVRRSTYEKFGGFNLKFRLAADFELMLRFLEKYKIHSIYLPQVLVNMRLGGATNKNISNIFKQNIEIFSALKMHDLKPSLFRLTIHKAMNKLLQYCKRPSN